MKTKLLFFTFFLMASVSFAGNMPQEQSQLDSKVTTAFNVKYPNATKVEWEPKQGFHVAEFMQNGIESEAWFDANGLWVMTKSELKYNMLPSAIRTTIEKSIYKNWKKEDVKKLEREGTSTQYIVEVEKNGHDMDLYYLEDGTLIKTLKDAPKAQLDNFIPIDPAIKNKITQKYPDAMIVETEMEDGMLHVDIIDNGLAKEAIFNNNNWVSTSWKVNKSELPVFVSQAIDNSAYKNYKIDDIHFYETPSKSYYWIELERGTTEAHIAVNRMGEIIQL